MPAISESYSGVSGAVIAGGRYHWPAWRRALAPLTWGEVGNTLSDINPRYDAAVNPNYPAIAPWNGSTGFSSVCSAWNGAVWDEGLKRLVLPLSGGHQDYAGNETYVWDSETGLFTMPIKPSGCIGNLLPEGGSFMDGLESTGVYFDGRPRSYHTYGNIQMRNGAVWMFGGSVYSGAGSGGVYPFRLDAGATEWVKDCETLNSGIGVSSSVVYDSLRDRFWYLTAATNPPIYYDPVAHQKVTMSGSITGDNTSTRGAYDVRRDLLVRLGQSICLITALGTTPVRTVITPTGSRPAANNGTSTQYNGTEGFQYDYANDRYLLWNGGTSIYVLTPPPVEQDPKTGTWAWSEMAASESNTVDPGVATLKGIYGRFWHSHKLAACGVFNQVTQKMHVFALE